MMYKFVCSNNHVSYSSAKDQTDPSCPTCGELVHLVEEDSLDIPTKGES